MTILVLLLNQRLNTQAVPYISSAEKSDLQQEGPADDGAGAVTGVGILPGQRGERESQQGHADVLAREKLKVSAQG